MALTICECGNFIFIYVYLAVFQDGMGGIVAGAASDAAAGMGARAAHIETFYG